jgi:hypothetical protein
LANELVLTTAGDDALEQHYMHATGAYQNAAAMPMAPGQRELTHEEKARFVFVVQGSVAV